MNYNKKKNSIAELQSILNDMVLTDNLNRQDILDVSRKLDTLITEYYMNKKKELTDKSS